MWFSLAEEILFLKMFVIFDSSDTPMTLSDWIKQRGFEGKVNIDRFTAWFKINFEQ